MDYLNYGKQVQQKPQPQQKPQQPQPQGFGQPQQKPQPQGFIDIQQKQKQFRKFNLHQMILLLGI